ncbi:MAG TPA: ribonuclease P protein component [bacterium]|nr:ribonuclease P protein component [bacterium]
MENFSFTRAERIRSRTEFQALKVNGSVFRTRKLLFNFGPGGSAARSSGPQAATTSRFGLVVTKKVGGSVFRNKVKRWLREAFRLNKNGFAAPLELIVVPRVSDLSFSDIEQDLRYFQKWYNEKNARRAH